MRGEIKIRLLNITLRALAMGSRLVLIFALASFLEPGELGLFGLILATVSFGVLIIGGDYYTYAHRELLARPLEKWSFVIQHQIKAQTFLYMALLPILLAIFIFELIEWKYIFWFYILLILEHISQEMNRLLTAMHRQLMASYVLFIRAGSWVLILIPSMYFFEELRNLNSIFIAWSIGSFLSIVLGFFVIKSSLLVWEKNNFDYKWLKKGFKTGALFFIATICFKGIVTFDRYAVEYLENIEMLGVYVFYASIVMGSYAILEPAIFSFLYPRMLESYQKGNILKYSKIFKELVISTLLVTILLAVFAWFIVPWLISLINKPIYLDYLEGLWILIMAGFFYSISFIPHYGLYSMKADRWIVSSHVSSLMIFFISLFFVQLNNGIETVSMALLSAFIWMAIFKTTGYLLNSINIKKVKI